MRFLPSLLILLSLADLALSDAPHEMAPDEVRRWIGFFDKLVEAVVHAEAETCDRLAADVTVVIDEHRDVVLLARSARAAGKHLPRSAQQHMLGGVRRMTPALRKCGQHAPVRAAFSKLDLR